MAHHAQAEIDEIIALERSYWEAMLHKDGKAAAALSGDLCLVAGHDGVRRIARDKMAAMTETGDWALQSYDLRDAEVTRPAPDIAMIVYKVRLSMTMKGGTHEIEAADSSTWLRQEGNWTCHAHSEAFMTDSVEVSQETPAPAAPPTEPAASQGITD